MTQGEGTPFSSGARGTTIPLDLSLVTPADWRALAIAGSSAVAVDLAVRSGVVGVAGAVAVAVAAEGMLASGRISNRQARVLVLLAPVFGIWLALRMSPWLVPIDIAAAGGLLALGASFARGGSVFDLSLPQAAVRAVTAAIHVPATPAFVLEPVRMIGRRLAVSGRGGQAGAVVRGLLLAVPVLVVLGALLASADAVFASALRLNANPAALAAHIAAIVVGAWGMAGLLRVASATPPPPVPGPGWRMGRVEAAVVLGSIVALFAAFAAAQLVVLAGGGRHVLETAGLTYAEYARSGFFQLVAVAVLTLGLVLSVRALADLRGTRLLFVLGEATVALTLVIVYVAVRRMDIYEQALGLTMLRLYVRLFSLWIGAVFVLLGLGLAGLGSGRSWLPAAAGVVGLTVVLALNVVNPEAVVVRHNVAFAERTGRFDPAYLAELSEDAVPTLVEVLPRLQKPARRAIRAEICRGSPWPWTGWAASNLSRTRAGHAAAVACGATHPAS
jgi:uncharacterized protein DUF4153